MDAHKASVRSGLQANDELNRLFGRMGTSEHPNGQVLVAYRNARRALRGALANADDPWRRAVAVREVMNGLRTTVEAAAWAIFADAVALGLEQSGRQLRAWGSHPGTVVGALAQEQQEAVGALGAQVDAQRAAATALALGNGEPELIYGNEEQQGVLRPSQVIAQGAFWVAALAAGAWAWQAQQDRRRTGTRWMHQAVAAIDERTTDCCLRVHGQTQPLDKPFQLTGDPRYADELDSPPFHWYCRTSQAMVPAEYAEDEMTAQMTDAAKAELKARGPEGKDRVEIHPSHARSRR